MPTCRGSDRSARTTIPSIDRSTVVGRAQPLTDVFGDAEVGDCSPTSDVRSTRTEYPSTDRPDRGHCSFPVLGDVRHMATWEGPLGTRGRSATLTENPNRS